MDDRTRAAIAGAVDLALVALFVVIGRASHREDEGDFLVTFWPFAVGLVERPCHSSIDLFSKYSS